MSVLPDSWALAPLGDLLSAIVGGGTPSKGNADHFRGSIPFMTVKDMHARFIEDTQDHITDKALAESTSTLVPADTLIVASRMSIGKIARPKVPVAINQDLKALFLYQGIDKTYIEYAWRANEARIRDLGTGTTVKGIRLDDIRGLKLPIAPSAEQIRIADQLDILLSHINACNGRLDAIPSILKRFRRAVFDTATTGRLTQVWRETGVESGDEKATIPEWARLKGLYQLPEGWRWARFSEFLSGIRSGTSAVPSAEPSAFPVLRSSSVRPRDIDFDDVRYLPNSTRVRGDDLLAEGDILFTRLSGSLDYVANCAVVRGIGDRTIYYPDRLFRAKLTDPEQGAYFELCFSSPLLRRHLTVEAKSTAGHQRISIGTVKEFPIPLPSKAEQQEINRQVGALFAIADHIETRYAALRKHTQRLVPQVLGKAFRGELVEQDPDDESATALLTRLASQRVIRSTELKARKPRQTRTTRAPVKAASMTKSRQDDDVKGQPYLANHLRRLGGPSSVETLFKVAELPVADFYKQLAWEVSQGHVKDNHTSLEPGHEAG